MVRHPAARQFATEPGRCHRGDPGAECGGAGRPDRRTPYRQRPAIPGERADPGSPDDTRAIRQHRIARESRRLPAARTRCRPGRPRRPEPGRRRPPQQRACGGDRHLSLPGRECGGRRCCSQSQSRSLEQTLSTWPQIPGQLRHNHLRPGYDPRCADHAVDRLCAGRNRRLRVPRQPARDRSYPQSRCRSV